MLLRVAFGFLLCALLTSPALGQAPPESQSSAQADSLTRAADSAGREAAGERGVAGYLFSSFLGGVPAGFFLPIGAVLSDGTSILLGGAGATVVIASTAEAADRDAEPPPALLNELRSRTPEYQEAFRSAYADQLRRRRVRASLWGGGVGAGVGLGALVWLVSQFSGDF